MIPLPRMDDLPVTIVLVENRVGLLDALVRRLTGAGYDVLPEALTGPIRDVTGEAGTQLIALRATSHARDDATEPRGLHVDLVRQTVVAAGTRLPLTQSEFGLLAFLVQRPGQAFAREAIIEAVKGNAYPVTPRSIDVQVLGLRRKLGTLGQWIETVRGVGYRFAAAAAPAVRLSTATDRAAPLLAEGVRS